VKIRVGPCRWSGRASSSSASTCKRQEAPDQVSGTTNRTDRRSHRIAVVDGCRPNERTVALAIGSMDFSDSPHVTVGVTNHHFAPAVAADGHIFERGVHSAGPLEGQEHARGACIALLISVAVILL